jgi:hypothetical protein
MKLKAPEVVQILVIAKAIREGKLDGNQVAEAALNEIIDRRVEGDKVMLDVVKALAKDVAAGFLGSVINIILKRLGPKESDADINES